MAGAIQADPRANLQKFLIRDRLELGIRDLRRQAVGRAYQRTLFGPDAVRHLGVSAEIAFEFQAQAYAPPRDYDGRFGHFDFRRHFYGHIGDFDSREEPNALAGSTAKCSGDVSGSGCATWSVVKAAPSSCKRPMAVSIPTSSVNSPTWTNPPGLCSPSNTRAPTAGPAPRTTA